MHDEKKIEGLKTKFRDDMTYGGRGNHLDDTMPVISAEEWFIKHLKQYAEHMVQQERGRCVEEARRVMRMSSIERQMSTLCGLLLADIIKAINQE